MNVKQKLHRRVCFKVTILGQAINIPFTFVIVLQAIISVRFHSDRRRKQTFRTMQRKHNQLIINPQSDSKVASEITVVFVSYQNYFLSLCRNEIRLYNSLV